MKNSSYLTKIAALAVLICLTYACSKDDNDSSNPTPNPTCNYTTDILAVGDSTRTIVSDSCRVFGSNYYTEHFANAAKTEAVAIIFNGTAKPAAGSYTAVNDITLVDATHAYVEYYTGPDAFQPSTGIVKVADNGTAKIYSFCKLSCSNGSTSKEVSLRSECQ